jgi:hypothetical protein
MAGIDHLVIGCATLAQGAAWLEALLGVPAVPGGQHPGVGTHNMLLGMGPSAYLELIAVDPAQPAPDRARPFGLDDPARRAALAEAPRLIAWVARVEDLAAVAARIGAEPRAMTRGSLVWRLAMPPDAALAPLVPALIQWDGPCAADQLPDSGVRLLSLALEHPEAAALAAAMSARGLQDSVATRPAAAPGLRALFRRGDGREVELAG